MYFLYSANSFYVPVSESLTKSSSSLGVFEPFFELTVTVKNNVFSCNFRITVIGRELQLEIFRLTDLDTDKTGFKAVYKLSGTDDERSSFSSSSVEFLAVDLSYIVDVYVITIVLFDCSFSRVDLLLFALRFSLILFLDIFVGHFDSGLFDLDAFIFAKLYVLGKIHPFVCGAHAASCKAEKDKNAQRYQSKSFYSFHNASYMNVSSDRSQMIHITFFP